MAVEVLPAQLLAKAESAWRHWCSSNTVELPPDYSSSSSSKLQKPPRCSSELWKAHQALDSWLHGAAAVAEGRVVLQPVLLPTETEEGGVEEEEQQQQQQQQQAAVAVQQVIGAWALQSNHGCHSSVRQTNSQPHTQQQQQQHVPAAAQTTIGCGSESPLDWPADWPLTLQQPLSLLQIQQPEAFGVDEPMNLSTAEGAAEADLQQQQQQQAAVLLLCLPDWYSSNESQQPLGAALLQLRLVQALQQQESGREDVHGHKQQEVESLAQPARLPSVHVPMSWVAALH
jgi:hypothetical protein